MSVKYVYETIVHNVSVFNILNYYAIVIDDGTKVVTETIPYMVTDI